MKSFFELRRLWLMPLIDLNYRLISFQWPSYTTELEFLKRALERVIYDRQFFPSKLEDSIQGRPGLVIAVLRDAF